MRKGRRERERQGEKTPDIEALGLVLTAAGLFLVGVLVPAIPSGELGRTVRGALAGNVGWAAYCLAVPPLVLGGFFLLRRNPSWWPRVLLGYVVLVAGLWGVSAAVWPDVAGDWGASLRAALGATWGVVAVLPAVAVATVGHDLLRGWRPFRTLTTALRTAADAVRTAYVAAAKARRSAKERAAFHADAALVRKGLAELDKDLQALSELFPTSGELDRWRNEVKAAHREMRAPTPQRLRDARADLKAWQAAVADFARDRAAELGAHLDAEAALAPEPSVGTFEAWCVALKQAIDDPVTTPGRAAQALDRLRKAIVLDLTALMERNRRLSRERDLDRRSLKGMAPRRLVEVSQAHARRVEAFRELEGEADRLGLDAEALEPWRELMTDLAEVMRGEPVAEVEDYDQTLAAELDTKGRQVLAQLEGWRAALAAVAKRAAAERAAMAERAAAEAQARAEAAVQAEAPYEVAGLPVPAADDWGSAEDDLPWDPVPEEGVEDALLDDLVAVGASPQNAAAGSRPTRPARSAPLTVVATETEEDGDEAEAPPAGREPVGAIPIQVPPVTLLDDVEASPQDREQMLQEHRARVRQIDETLANFKLGGRVTAAVRGPTVTRFEVEPAPGEKISRFANLSDDLALAMAVGSVRIEAPIPGKSVIGLEVPNAHRELVRFREAVEAPTFRRAKARLPLVLGRSIDGEMMVGDLARMPHLLIAGSTGSGKSVAVNALIASLLFRFLPTELRFLMIDPKMVELTPFDGIPHLLRPVVTNPKDAAGVLIGAVAHMERRYQMMSKIGAKNLDQYNEKARNLDLPPMPFIVIVIDELADLMITSPKEVESSIMRLAQMARATGMHLILATQRPSVDILTSLIKVNVPARMAFAVSSSHDSRTILDGMGAERLIGLGDMLFYQPGLVKAVRLQGPFVSENEIVRLADFLRRQYFDDDFVEAYGADFDPPPADESTASGLIDWNDDKLRAAAELVISEGQASVSRLQRRLSVGHARAGKLMDSLEALGVVGPHTGSKPREVLVTMDELPNIFGK
ncbi:MAG TPA: DNA translocase FtsK [Trueperaceae bacterium]|nr:DNA translocase FtsK [Trueperaceae bacterium]